MDGHGTCAGRVIELHGWILLNESVKWLPNRGRGIEVDATASVYMHVHAVVKLDANA
jgi:hypothetical protein